MQENEGKEILEIGYLFKKKHWKKGYATEAAKACRDYTFEVLKVENVYSIIRDSNTASQNVALRIGMKKVSETMKRYYDMDMLHYVYEIKKDPGL
jgi:RimJ/RimL family protein N-acetyltransferase